MMTTLFTEKPNLQTFTDAENQHELQFKQREFLCVTFEVLVHYLRYDTHYAQDLIIGSMLYQKVTDYFSAQAIVTYSEYHWAMLLAHGHKYWQEGFNIEEPDDYKQFRRTAVKKYEGFAS